MRESAVSQVKTGITGATDIEVLSGLNEGDEIITGSYEVIRTIRNDAKVKVDNKTPRPLSRWQVNESPRFKRWRPSKQLPGTQLRKQREERGEQLKREGIVIRTLRSLEDVHHGRSGNPRSFRCGYRDHPRGVCRHHGSFGFRENRR